MLKRDRLIEAQASGGWKTFKDRHLPVDSAVGNFGLEWTELDPYPRLQALSYGHIFSRFLLPVDFFRDKSVVDLGCGNGRLGSLFAADTRSYVGVELSEAITAFWAPDSARERVTLVQASIENLPLQDGAADVALCWGVLHHVRDPMAALAEMTRVLKPGGAMLLYVYPDTFGPRENLNRLIKHVDPAYFKDFCRWFTGMGRILTELDPMLTKELYALMQASPKRNDEWEVMQTFDGLSPAHHHLLEKQIPKAFAAPWQVVPKAPGCFIVSRPGDR